MATKKICQRELEQETETPNFWNNPQRAGQVSRELNNLKQGISEWEAVEHEVTDIEATLELLEESPDQELEQELRGKFASLTQQLKELEFHQMLSGPTDRNNAILNINAGAGGTESCDWAEMLLRMYRRWADHHGFKNEVVDFTAGDQAGFRSATVTVDGPYAYGLLKAEIGVHRLVRISPFDANKRRHTSFASIFVFPEVDDTIEIEIREEDIRMDTFRSSGAGGQKVNKTDSAVRLTHIPSGIAVACQIERSQHRNRDTAMKLLKAKLYEVELKKQEAERAKVEGEKSDNTWGSQIRSYVLAPYRMVKDHRTDHETGDTEAVLDGELDGFIRSYLLRGKE